MIAGKLPTGSRRKLFLLAAAIVLAAFYLSVGLSYGPIVTPDGLRDMAYANTLPRLGYDPVRLANEAEALAGFEHSVPLQMYALYIYMLAALHSVAGSSWPSALVTINALLQASIGSVVLAMVWRAGSGIVGAIVAMIFLLVLFDFYQWAAMTQSEPLFILLAAVAHDGVARALSETHARRKILWWAGCALIAVAAVFTRPLWPPLVATITALAAYSIAKARGIRFSATQIAALVFAAVAAAAALILAAASAYFDPDMVPSAAAREALHDFRPWFAEGAVVLARPETFVVPADSVWGFARVSLARIPYFFWFVGSAFSERHTWLNVVTHVPLYVLAMAGTFMLRRSDAVPPFGRAAAAFAVTYIILSDLFCAVTYIDFDWRYRAPIYPSIIYLAAVGAALSVAALRRRSYAARRAIGSGTA